MHVILKPLYWYIKNYNTINIRKGIQNLEKTFVKYTWVNLLALTYKKFFIKKYKES